MMGQPIGAGVEFGVRQRRVAVHQGRGLRSAGRLCLDRADEGGGREGDLGAVELVEDQDLFVRRRDAVRGQRQMGVGLGEPLQQMNEPVLVRGQFGLPVQRRVAVVVDAQAPAVGAVVDVDREVVDRSRGQVAGAGGGTGEVHAVVERHDVDQRAHQAP